MPRRSNITKATLPLAVTMAMNLLLSNMPGDEVVRSISDEYSITVMEAKSVVRKASQEIATRSAFDREREFNKTMERLELLWQMAIERNSINSALEIEKFRAKLFNLQPPEKTEVVHTERRELSLEISLSDLDRIPLDERKSLLKMLEDKRSAVIDV